MDLLQEMYEDYVDIFSLALNVYRFPNNDKLVFNGDELTFNGSPVNERMKPSFYEYWVNDIWKKEIEANR